MRELIRSAAAAARRYGPPRFRALIGFDGFVDEIIHVVDKRINDRDYTPIPSIAALAERIGRAAGLSTNLELVTQEVKIGGNGPIMAQALLALGARPRYIGALGDPEIHPVFREFARATEAVSIADPGHTDALEFRDGKLILGKHGPLRDIHWQRILERAGEPLLLELLAGSELVAFVNWTMLPHMTEIWRQMTATLLPKLPVREPKPWIFFDLADPEKRTAEELAEAVQWIGAFGSHFRPVLGLNRKEATEVARALRLELPQPAETAPLAVIVPALAAALPHLDGLVVHPTTEAASVFGGRYDHVRGATARKPRLTTGAGDNFNAGFCTGLLLGLEPSHALVLGKGVAGFYVRQGRSPSWNELLQFLDAWADRVDEEF